MSDKIGASDHLLHLFVSVVTRAARGISEGNVWPQIDSRELEQNKKNTSALIPQEPSDSSVSIQKGKSAARPRCSPLWRGVRGVFVLQEGLGTKCSPQRHNEFKHHGVVLELVVLIPFPVLVLLLVGRNPSDESTCGPIEPPRLLPPAVCSLCGGWHSRPRLISVLCCGLSFNTSYSKEKISSFFLVLLLLNFCFQRDSSPQN